MFKEAFIEELSLWSLSFGDVKLLCDTTTKELWLKPKKIDNNIVLLNNLGIGKIYSFCLEDFSNTNTTSVFFLYRKLNSTVILIHKLKNKGLVFEEQGKITRKPEKYRYYYYKDTEIYHLCNRDAYSVYNERVKLMLPDNSEILKD